MLSYLTGPNISLKKKQGWHIHGVEVRITQEPWSRQTKLLSSGIWALDNYNVVSAEVSETIPKNVNFPISPKSSSRSPASVRLLFADLSSSLDKKNHNKSVPKSKPEISALPPL